MSKSEKAKRIAQKKRLGQPAGTPRRVEAARRKKRGTKKNVILKLEQAKNQKAVEDVYTRMKTLKTQLKSNSQLHLTQEQQLQRLKRSINLMQEKFKSCQLENKERK